MWMALRAGKGVCLGRAHVPDCVKRLHHAVLHAAAKVHTYNAHGWLFAEQVALQALAQACSRINSRWQRYSIQICSNEENRYAAMSDSSDEVCAVSRTISGAIALVGHVGAVFMLTKRVHISFAQVSEMDMTSLTGSDPAIA
jgi:hypothetical protein